MTHQLKAFEYRIENDVTIDSVSELRLCLQSPLESKVSLTLYLLPGVVFDTAGLQFLLWLQSSIYPAELTIYLHPGHNLLQLLTCFELQAPFKLVLES